MQRLTRLHKLKNRNCPYCGIDLFGVRQNVDHVIGRKFPPKGQLAAQWNIALQCCVACNSEKSALEGEMSAISLQSIHTQTQEIDLLSASEGRRKSTNKILKTGRPVKDSFCSNSMEFNFGVMKFRFNTIAPPQIEEALALKLAFQQISGFFFFITFSNETRRGGFCPAPFNGFQISRKSDWGNPVATIFAKIVRGWEKRLVGETANGFYKVAIRRSPNAECWSWAVEWNKSVRLFGAFGDENEIAALSSQLPALEFQQLDSQNRIRWEVPLDAGDDLMFED